ncbi:hypothetical protein Tco_0024442 [Tanacetum coccineum]
MNLSTSLLPVQEQGDTVASLYDSSNMHTFIKPSILPHNVGQEIIPLEQVIGYPYQSVSTRRQARITDGDMCMEENFISLTIRCMGISLLQTTFRKDAKGYAQKEGIVFKESFCTVARLEAVRLINATPVSSYAFLDSDHAGCLDSRKSTSGGIQFIGGDKLVSWSSKKQDCTSMSSAEAETEYQLADLFAKALSEDRFKYLVRRLGMRCLTPDELEVLVNESA